MNVLCSPAHLHRSAATLSCICVVVCTKEAPLCELKCFHNKAYLHRKETILRRIYEYCLIHTHVNGKGNMMLL